MKTLVAAILGLIVILATVVSVQRAHTAYHSLWLDLYLVLFVALPLATAIPGARVGRQGVKNLFRVLLSVTAGLLITTVIYQRFTPNWLWACLAGGLIPGFVTTVREWRVSSAQVKLTQASEALKKGEHEQVVKLAQDARTIFIARGNRANQALAEWHLGVAYEHTGEPIRAARYLNSALALFRSLGKKEQAGQVEQSLAQLRRVGVDTDASAVSAEALQEEVVGIDWGFLLDGVLTISFALALLQLWKVKAFQASPLMLTVAGVVLLLFIYGNYAVISLRTGPAREVRGIQWVLLFYNITILLLVLSFTGLLLERGILHVTNFPSALQVPLSRFSALTTGWPSWTMPVATAVCAFLLSSAMFVASGRSPLRFLSGLGRGEVGRQALQLAIGHLDAKEWSQAITQLTRIDLTKGRDTERQKEVLFHLGFAHHMAEHPAEARQYIQELLEVDPQYKEGLYLSGYMALQANQIEEAEDAWRRLYRIAPDFRPIGNGTADRDVRYYLCLTIYRKAMSMMDKDAQEGAKLLAEVGEFGALDREVADALIRVHLHRCVQMIRRREWSVAAHEVELARRKLEHLEQLIKDPAEIAKLKGLWQAASGLVALRQERYGEAIKDFSKADEVTKDLARKRFLFGEGGGSFLEQLLRLAMEQAGGEEHIHSSFSRDLYFLEGLLQLRALHDDLVQSSAPNWKSILSQVESRMEESLAVNPEFSEGRTMLGLLYYYLGTEEAKKEKGVEILRTVRDRIGSRFVTETVTRYDTERQRRMDARKAYFDLLQRYLRFSNVPLEQRMALREQVLEGLKITGQYEAFVGQGGLEIESQKGREPTVQEYINRANLLREKLDKLRQLQADGNLPSELNALLEQLNTYNQQLQQHTNSIAETEQRLLIAAQRLL